MHRYTVFCDFLGYFCNYAPGTGLPTESFSWKSTHQNLRLQASPLQSSHVRSGADDGSGAHACVHGSHGFPVSEHSGCDFAYDWCCTCAHGKISKVHTSSMRCHGCSRAKTNASFPALTQHDRASVLWNRPHPPLPPILSDLQHACKQKMWKCTLKVKGCPSCMQASWLVDSKRRGGSWII